MHTPVHQQQLEQIKTQYLCHQHDITIDRDTVLKINRFATRRNLHKRDHSWPPPSNDYTKAGSTEDGRRHADEGEVRTYGHGTQSLTKSRSASNEKCTCTNNAVHFAESVCKRHDIDAIRKKFNSPTRIIEPTPTELRQQRNKMKQTNFQKKKERERKNATNKSARVNVDDSCSQEMKQRTDVCSIGIVGDAAMSQQQTLTNVHNNMANTSSVNAASADTFHYPATSAVVGATKLHWLGAVEIDADRNERDTTKIVHATDSGNILDDCNTPKARGFSAPETKAADENIGLVEPRRNYFEQLAARGEHGVHKKWCSYDNIATAETADGVTSSQQQQHFNKGNTTTAKAIYNNRQSQSLDRGRATQQQCRREQLPPLKPRAGSGGGSVTISRGASPAGRITPAHSASEVNVMACNGEGSATSSGRGHTSQTHSGKSTSPRIQRRAIKLATEIKICYNDVNADDAVDVVFGYGGNLAAGGTNDFRVRTIPPKTTGDAGKASVVDKSMSSTFVASEQPSHEDSIKKRHSSDLEHLPLPPTPQEGKELTKTAKMFKSSNLDKVPTQQEQERSQYKQKQQEQQTTRNLPQQQQQHRPHQRSSSESGAHTTRIIPIECEQQLNRAMRALKYQAPPRRDLSTVSADQLYDDACIYLRSIDLDDRTIAYIPAAITIAPSPTEEMLQRWTAGEQTQNLKADTATNQEEKTREERHIVSRTGTPQATPAPIVTQRNSSRTFASKPIKQASHCRAPTPADSDYNKNVKPHSSSDTNNHRKNAFYNEHEVARLKISNKYSAVDIAEAERAACNAQNIVSQKLNTEHERSKILQTRERQAQPQEKSTPNVSAIEATIRNSQAGAALGQQNQQRLRAERPRGIYYTDGEYLHGTFAAKAAMCYDECKNGGSASKRETKTTIQTLKSPSAADSNNKHSKKRNGIDAKLSSRDMKAQKEQVHKKYRMVQLEKQKEQQQQKLCYQQPRSPSAPPTAERNERTNMEQNAAEIAALEAKYGHFQQSIAKHLRQIDAYMENAKQTLSRSLQIQQQEKGKALSENEARQVQNEEKERQVQNQLQEEEQAKKQEKNQRQQKLQRSQAQSISLNILAPTTSSPTASAVFLLNESPLRALARQLLPKQTLHVASVTNDAYDDGDENLRAMRAPHILHPIVLENMPVVERALQALSEVIVESADVATKGKQSKIAAYKPVDDGLDNNQTKRADGSIILQPLMRRLIAVQPKAITNADNAPNEDDNRPKLGDTVECLAIEHHFVPRATLAKRVTILENLDDVIVTAAGRLRQVRADNIQLIEIENKDMAANVSSDCDDSEEIALAVNEKVDDVSEICDVNDLAADRIVEVSRKGSSGSSSKDITKLEEIETIDEVIEVNENGNFEYISTARPNQNVGVKPKEQEIGLAAQHDEDTIKSKSTADGIALEHVVDVVANYEQKFMQRPAAKATKMANREQVEQEPQQQQLEIQQKQQQQQKQEKPKQQNMQYRLELQELKKPQQEIQQQQQQNFTESTAMTTEAHELAKPMKPTTQIAATRSTPTTPVLRRRTLSMVEEEPTTTTNTRKASKIAEAIDESENKRSFTETQRRQQKHALLQEQAKQVKKVPIPPPPPPPPLPMPPLRTATQQQETNPRAASLPKDLCKNVVSGYISTHQSQEHLVEQVTDVLHTDESQQSEKAQMQKQILQQLQQKEMPHETQQSEPVKQKSWERSETQIANKLPDITGRKTAKHEQKQLSFGSVDNVRRDQLVNQEQSASFAVTKVNPKPFSEQNRQISKILAGSCKYHVEKQEDKQTARNMITTAAEEAAAMAAQKPVTEERKNSEATEQCDKRRVFTAQHGKLKLQINACNNKVKEVPKAFEEAFDTYKATYEIPSPIFKQEIVWKQSIDVPQKTENKINYVGNVRDAQPKENESQIDSASQGMQLKEAPLLKKSSTFNEKPTVTSRETAVKSYATEKSNTNTRDALKTKARAQHTSIERSQTPTLRPSHHRPDRSSSPIRKYTAALIEPHVPKRAASPYGLIAVDTLTDTTKQTTLTPSVRHSCSRSISPCAQYNSLPSSPIRKYPAGIIEPYVPRRSAAPFGLNAVERVQRSLSRSLSPRTQNNSRPTSPIRKYPAALIEPHIPKRAASPFGLNSLQTCSRATSQLRTIRRSQSRSVSPHTQRNSTSSSASAIHKYPASLIEPHIPTCDTFGLNPAGNLAETYKHQVSSARTVRSTRSRSVSPRTQCTVIPSSSMPVRKYPAALIEPHIPTRAASPFGLNPIDISELIDDTASYAIAADDDGQHLQQQKSGELDATNNSNEVHNVRTHVTEYVPQMEGHNVGLLVRGAIAPTAQHQRCSESSQIKMDKALTHSAVTHYVDADGTDDDDDDDDELYSHARKITSTPSQTQTTTTTPTKFTAPISLSASSSSLVSVTRSTRACSLHPRADIEVHDGQNKTLKHSEAHLPHSIPTNTQTQTSYLFADRLVPDFSNSAPITKTGKSYERVQSSQAGYSYGNAEFERQQGFENQQQVLTDDSSNKPLRWGNVDVVIEPADKLHHHQPRESAIINRSFDNVSPRPYNSIEGYKRVAWPPSSEERVVREFTPQPTAAHYPVSAGQQQQQPAQQHQPHYLQQQPQQHHQPTHCQQQQQPSAAPTNRYRATSYDQYQQQPQHQYQPHQGSQPAYGAPSYQQPPYQSPQQQQQRPSWAHNQQALQYQPAQAPSQQAPTQQQQYQAPPSSNYQTQPPYQSQYQAQPQTQYSSVPLSNQYNSYSQPQHVGQDQLDQRASAVQSQSLPQDYRGGSPGIITLRKEAPMTQKPQPVYNAQPAAISLQGGSHLRGDLKWPPPEYKEAAARENEERRKLALGPVCRPRLVKRDYTQFFAKNAINSCYPSYKVPPGTQHMLA
ncbi:uncharacterized protein [Eurosta solidaginis]|uniref:uncharacterized protein isoform X2 n=1 Tax=Eurosta solidaginis TaxID=178769 RepID=UPI0035305C6F